MKQELLVNFIGNKTLTIVDAMAKIDENARGLLFIVDEEERLAGCITDGDIRRWILHSGSLETTVSEVMNTSPKYLMASEASSGLAFMRREVITAVPLLDEERHIVDILVLSEENGDYAKRRKKDLSNVPVVVMAGGKGTRLYPYTKILPKPLIPIGDTPIMERILNCFVEYGIRKFTMTVNFKKGMIKSYFRDLEPDYEISYVEETEPLGTAGSIKLIEEKYDRPLFVINCDALILADYADIYDYHVKSQNAITVVAALKNITVPYGVLHAGENGELHSMEEKPRLSYFINTGMYVMNPDVIEQIPDNTFFHMTHLIDKVMASGRKVGTYPISEDSFLDMGEFDEMKRMEQKLNVIVD